MYHSACLFSYRSYRQDFFFEVYESTLNLKQRIIHIHAIILKNPVDIFALAKRESKGYPEPMLYQLLHSNLLLYSPI